MPYFERCESQLPITSTTTTEYIGFKQMYGFSDNVWVTVLGCNPSCSHFSPGILLMSADLAEVTTAAEIYDNHVTLEPLDHMTSAGVLVESVM